MVELDVAGWIGTPFEIGGRGPEIFDCYGFLMQCYREHRGIEIPDFVSSANHHRVGRAMARNMRLWRRVERQPGVGILLRLHDSTACHVGFTTSNFWFAHTWEESGGVVRERIANWQRQQKVVGFFDFVAAPLVDSEPALVE
ncbi:NlpC/P60 family protein [Inquilinus sp. OTU3971]|uniref:NlpC/P60 family protein n=1 Tax=Inquilinus sp. OTU3971 TaxID=3043855 RepID=UPI00313C5470